MMRKTMRRLGIFALAVGMVGWVLHTEAGWVEGAMRGGGSSSQQESATQPSASSTYAKETSGKITSVRPDEQLLELKKGGMMGKPMSFVVNFSTAITEGPKELSLNDLKVGDEIKVHYATEGDKNVARAIDRQVKEAKPIRGS